MSRINYIFVDFENVQETGLDRIANRLVKVALVLGRRHRHLPVELVKKLLRYVGQVQLIETGRDGKNALDLVCQLLARLQKEKKVKALGTGRGAKWEKLGN